MKTNFQIVCFTTHVVSQCAYVLCNFNFMWHVTTRSFILILFLVHNDGFQSLNFLAITAILAIKHGLITELSQEGHHPTFRKRSSIFVNLGGEINYFS